MVYSPITHSSFQKLTRFELKKKPWKTVSFVSPSRGTVYYFRFRVVHCLLLTCLVDTWWQKMVLSIIFGVYRYRKASSILLTNLSSALCSVCWSNKMSACLSWINCDILVTIQIALFKLIISRVFQVNFSSRDSRQLGQLGLTIRATVTS
jgi:hypothetical protein